jgi:hypothetical protein
MKNVYMYILLFMIGCVKSFGQGTDVIFLIDNSGSIDNTEYANLQTSVAAIMASVLECNPENRITVVQYSSGQIYIESDFSLNGYTFPRRFNNGIGGVPAAVDLISDALNGTTSANILGTPTLNTLSGNGLAVYLFTDAPRNNDLLTGSPVTGSNLGFVSYTNFKNTHDATFVVTNTEIVAATIAASAGIASVGGAYTGTVESYSADPDGAGVVPRFFLNSSFLLTPLEIEIITDYLCSVTEPECLPNLTLVSSANDVISGQDNRQVSNTLTASNDIYAFAVGVYHSENTIVLTDGFHARNSSRFRAYIDECNSGYVGRPANTVAEEQETPVFADKQYVFSLNPNPANDKVTITSDKLIKSIIITAMDGKVIFSRDITKEVKEYDINISNYTKGIYNLTIIMDTGEIQTQKLIKN